MSSNDVVYINSLDAENKKNKELCSDNISF